MGLRRGDVVTAAIDGGAFAPLAVMSIFRAADLLTMSLQLGELWPPEREKPVAMRLLADGVPLALLVDLAVPPGPDTDAHEDTDRAVSP